MSKGVRHDRPEGRIPDEVVDAFFDRELDEGSRANLFRSNLGKADLTDAILEQANLYDSETLDARVERTRMDFANLKRTKLEVP